MQRPAGRSLVDVLNTANMMRDADIGVRSIFGGVDPVTSTGRLMLNMLATAAEYERELIMERVNVGIAIARQSGTRFERPLSDPTSSLRSASFLARLERRARPQPRLRPWSFGVEQRLTGTSNAEAFRS